MVNEHVLIPRPETEELCQWILAADLHELTQAVRSRPLSSAAQILDIGTGSGCIAITLAAEMPQAEVTAWDISAEALMVAAENARRHNVHVSFEQVDALHLTSDICHQASAVFDIIVSNPPYICHKEREAMENNVLEHEPHMALFVPDDDPLLFYRAIAQYGQSALKDDGWLYFEINPIYAEALCDMLSKMSYRDIEIKEDQYGKQRMIRAKRCAKR
jgi:release factor glutamine methyltransferase